MYIYKKLFFIIRIFFFLIPLAAFSQKKTQVVKTNTIGLVLGNFNVSYEKVLNPKSSVVLTGGLLSSATIISSELNAVSLGGAYRYYPAYMRKTVPFGLWVAPRSSIIIGNTISSNDDSRGFHMFTIGGEAGYQWVFKRVITFEPGFGISYILMREEREDKWISRGGGALPLLIVAFGYAF